MVIFKIDVYLQRIKRSFFDLYSILINNKLPPFPTQNSLQKTNNIFLKKTIHLTLYILHKGIQKPP